MSKLIKSGYHRDETIGEAVRMSYKKPYNNEEIETLKDIEQYPCVAVPFRNITQEAASYFGVRSSFSPEDGKTIIATYYPYRDKYGKITGYKKRDWTKQKEEKRHITVVGVLKISNQLFGQYQVDSGASRKKLIQLEGEDNVICAWQAILDNLRDSAKNPQCPKGIKDYLKSLEDGIKSGNTEGKPTIGVVGLSLGTANAVEVIANNEKFVRGFEEYVLALDNDQATEQESLKGIKKGKEATDDIATFLLSDNVFSVQWPDERNDPHGLNDPRDFVSNGRYKELATLLTKCSNRYVPDKVISLSDITIEDLRKKKKDGIPMPFFPELYKKTRGPRKGELWVVSGPSGSGKTTLSRRIEYGIANYLMDDASTKLEGWTQEERLGIIHLEEDEDESINSLYAIEKGFDEKDFVANPEDFLTEDEHTELHTTWVKADKVKIFDHFGSIPVEDLISKLKHMVYIDGCKWIILDHLSIVISGLGIADERKALDEAMTALATFCKQYDVFILAISHLKRTDFQPPKVKDGEEAKPFFIPVRKEQLRGSAALEQLAWVVLAVEPEELPNRERGRVRWVVLKNRPHKKLGVCDTLYMNENGKFIDASSWEWIDGCFNGIGAPKLPNPVYTGDTEY